MQETGVDQRPLVGGEREGRGEFELGQFARRTPHAQMRQLPVFHRAVLKSVGRTGKRSPTLSDDNR